MTTGGTVDLHHALEGPEAAPVVVPANSPGTTLQMWDDQATALREHFRLLRDRLGAIRAPTLVVADAAAPAAAMDQAELIRDSVPGARLVVEQAAHRANVERPGAATRALLDHFEPLLEGRVG